MQTHNEPLEPILFEQAGKAYQVWIDEQGKLGVLIAGRGNGRMRIEPSSHMTCTILTESHNQ